MVIFVIFMELVRSFNDDVVCVSNYITRHFRLTLKPLEFLLQTKAHLDQALTNGDGEQVKMSTDVFCHVILKKERPSLPIISYCFKAL